jgi:hypothetical protein
LGVKTRLKRRKKIQTQAHTSIYDTPIGYLNSNRCLGRTWGWEKEEGGYENQEDDESYATRMSHCIFYSIRLIILII